MMNNKDLKIAKQFDSNSQLIVDRPSQWLNIGYFLLTIGLTFVSMELAFTSLIILIWKSLVLYFTKWSYTTDTILERVGVFNVTTDEIQFFRIKDLRLYQPLLYRIVGISRLILITSDKFKPVLVLDGIRNGKRKRDMLKALAISSRREMGVKEFDVR
ncbi:MAG: PH domain-containing protein [Flavobacteriaceae bacterium]|nr:PH domain-containing protein [Flavobacteriaceae bacterium]